MSEDPTRRLHNDDLKLILARLDSIDGRLERVEAVNERLEARSYDTKPIWENALKEIADTRIELRDTRGALEVNFREALEKGLRETREAFAVHLRETREALETTFREALEAGLRRVERKLDLLNHNILDVRADVREIEERVEKLESQPTQ